MLEQQIKNTLDQYIIEYSSFIGMKYSPRFDLKFKEVSQAQADIDGIDSLANCTAVEFERLTNVNVATTQKYWVVA